MRAAIARRPGATRPTHRPTSLKRVIMSDEKRSEIVRLAREYFESRPEPAFEPGVTYIPPSGKVLDAEDCGNLIDASLDMWLTAGRYAEQLEAAPATTLAR